LAGEAAVTASPAVVWNFHRDRAPDRLLHPRLRSSDGKIRGRSRPEQRPRLGFGHPTWRRTRPGQVFHLRIPRFSCPGKSSVHHLRKI